MRTLLSTVCRPSAPSRARLRRARLVRTATAGVLAALAVAGCSAVSGSGDVDPVTAYFGPGGKPVPTADAPTGTAVTSPAEAAKVIAAAFPTSAAGIAAADVAAVRDVVVRTLSKLHGDPTWICGESTGKDPVESEFPPGGKWTRDPKQNPFQHFHALYQLPGCDQARLSGVYVGKQAFTVATEKAGEVRVDHAGIFTYDTRALANGVRLPVHIVTHRTFYLKKYSDGQYHISRLINAFNQAAPGYGAVLPQYSGEVPGLQLANQLSAPDAAAADSVRAALAASIAVNQADVTFSDRSSAPWRERAPDLRTGQFWPKEGAALYTYAKPKEQVDRYGVREFVIDKLGDYDEYNVADGAGRKFIQWDPTITPEVADIPTDSNPYVALAVLAQLESAAPTPCRSTEQSQQCFVVGVPVARLAVTGTLTTRVGHAYASYGVGTLTLKVGITDGKVSLISQDAILPVVGHGVAQVHWMFTFAKYAAAGAPPALTAPPEAQIDKR